MVKFCGPVWVLYDNVDCTVIYEFFYRPSLWGGLAEGLVSSLIHIDFVVIGEILTDMDDTDKKTVEKLV